MITRRNVLAAGGFGLLVGHRLGYGQPATTMRQVGVLFLPTEGATTKVRDAFTQGMRDLGWLEGKNVEYRFLYAGGDAGRLDALAVELIRQRVDVMVTPSSQATRVAQRATKAIPIVMASVPNAVGAGLVASLARPGGNITGITNEQEELVGKVIEILHMAAPGARRIAIMLNETSLAQVESWAGARSACASLGLIALRIVASTPEQIGPAVEQIVQQHADAVVVIRDGLYLSERARLQELMQATRLPVAYGFREHVAIGGLLSYSADLAANFRQAAKYVDKILRGAKPADLPVEQPTKFELAINLKTAKSLGLTIPQSLLLRADEVIQL